MKIEDAALAEGVRYLREHPECGQVAFGFNLVEGKHGVNSVYPTQDYPKATWNTVYANFGITRRAAADEVVEITGGFWAPVYRTYAADCELSAWIHKLGWDVKALPHLRVNDVREEDGLRKSNVVNSGVEAKRMYLRWPAEAFRPDGPEPRVSPEELARFRAVRAVKARANATGGIVADPVLEHTRLDDMPAQVASLVGWPLPEEEKRLQRLAPLVRALDPIGTFPKRAERLASERVLHVSLCTKADPQAGLVRALKGFGEYKEVRWYEDYGHDREARQRAILYAAGELRPTLVFMQLQTPNAVDVETVRALRAISNPVIVTWNGDIANENSPFNVDWQVEIGRAVDLTLHSSYSHVLALRAAGVHNASYLQIGYDDEHYQPPIGINESGTDLLEDVYATKQYDVCFLGSRYPADSVFAKSMRWHDASLRDDVVTAMHEAFGARFGLFGRGWEAIVPGHKDVVVPLDRAHETYWRSRIGLSVSLANDLECYSSDRLHRILGCGALALVKRFPGMETTWGLKHDTNCLAWDTPQQAVALARSVVFNLNGGDGEDMRVATANIADAGARLAAAHLTWDVRMRELVPYLEAVRSAR